MNKVILLVFCHLVGDYVLQNDFIAKTKGSNWYHSFIFCKNRNEVSKAMKPDRFTITTKKFDFMKLKKNLDYIHI